MNSATRLLLYSGLIFILFFALVSSVSAGIKTFTVNETDFVKITPLAIDPNKDKIEYVFTAPLNSKGEWQTDFGDAGEYVINVTASDGEETTMQKILLIVKTTNRAPKFLEKRLVIKETQSIDLKDIIIDPDGDALQYTFSSPFDKNGLWQTHYGDAGTFITFFNVSDGIVKSKARVQIVVLATDQPPQINHSFSDKEKLRVYENQSLYYFVNISYSNERKLTYKWTLDDKVISNKSYGEYEFEFNSSRERILQVEVTEDKLTTVKTWTLLVQDVKRAPVIKIPSVTVQEGEVAVLSLPEIDQDGHDLYYRFFGLPFEDDGTWQTDYEDAGEYVVIVSASNGGKETKVEAKVHVLDVDRAPTIGMPDYIESSEGTLLSLPLAAQDPDGDKLSVTLTNLPADAVYNEKNGTILWTPSYETIVRSPGFVNDLLNALRLEKYFIQPQEFNFKVSACGKELCSSKDIKILVHDTNRQPEFTALSGLSVLETDMVKLTASAIDLDGDIVRYYYGEPLGKRNGRWKTNYGDHGNYTIYVTATDGKEGNTQPVTVQVLKNNRAPTLKISDDVFTVNEGQQFQLKINAADADGDALNVSLSDLPAGATLADGLFTWTPSYDIVTERTDSWRNKFGEGFLNRKLSVDKAEVWLSFVADDGEVQTTFPVKVIVKNVNRAPEILDYFPANAEDMKVQTGTPLVFHAVARDADGEALYYDWNFGWGDKVSGTDTVRRVFSDPGVKKVTVTISDGWKKVSKEWKVGVVGNTVQILPEEQPVYPAEEPFSIKVYVVEK